MAESQIIQYRETHIRRRAFGETEWFAIVGSPTIYETLYAAKLAVNRQKLTAASRLSDEALLQRFIDADRNRDSFLDWDEISLFQLELCEEFEYQHNDIALPPHHFLALGGGDCEDWALVTAALLRFWGIESLIASVKEDADESPHAITLMRSSSPPEDFGRIHLHESMLRHVPNATPGLYVPIDYHFVGSVSPAVGPNYRYLWVDRPEFLYDLGL